MWPFFYSTPGYFNFSYMYVVYFWTSLCNWLFLAGGCHFTFYWVFFFGWLVRDDSNGFVFATLKAAFQNRDSTREV